MYKYDRNYQILSDITYKYNHKPQIMSAIECKHKRNLYKHERKP